MMKKIHLYLLVLVGSFAMANLLPAQTNTNRPSIVKIEGTGQFDEKDEKANTINQQVVSAEGFSYYTTVDGIYIYFPKTDNNVRLFALTGQLLWSGELVSGRFFIPTGQGIFFLRVNNKSYKISCK